MKHTLRRITVFTVICLFLGITGCQEDLPEKEQQGITPKSSSEVSYLTEQETADAVAMYNNQLSKATRAINFTFDGKDMMMLPDQFSKKQYTFMVQHENDSELVFHNVVITDWDGYKKTMLVKYEMTEDFAEKFANGLVGFNDFTGNVTYELLTADEGYPCGEIPGAGIPISGGNGPGGGSSGGSGYGSGQPWNPSGNGNPYNQDAVNDRFLMMEMEYMSAQFNQPLYAHQSPRNIGEIDRITPEPYSFIPSIDDTTNPCGEGDEIGVLVPIFFDIKIDRLFWLNYNCQAKVVIDAYSACSDLNNVFLSIFEGSDRYNIKYMNAADLGDEDANAITKYAGTTVSPNGTITYNITITFKNNYLNTATDLSIVRTAIHENIHAILMYLAMVDFLNEEYIPIDDNLTYQQLLKAYSDKMEELGTYTYLPFNGNLHHGFMADFINDIAETLKAYGISKGYNLSDQFYNDMAWGGLTHIEDAEGNKISNPVFLALVPNGNDRTRIKNRLAAENSNTTREDAIPSLSQNSCN